MLFLLLVNDRSAAATYDQYVFVAFGWVQDLLFNTVAIVRPFDLAVAIMLVVALVKRRNKAPLVRPMRNALLLQVATILLWFVYGVVTGGDARSACWQVYLLLTSALFAFLLAATFETVEQFAILGRVIVAAALYHAAVCWWFYLGAFKNINPPPEYVTCHDDTVLWVGAILTLIAHAIDKHSLKTTILVFAAIVFIVVAIQFNNRRLAWVTRNLPPACWRSSRAGADTLPAASVPGRSHARRLRMGRRQPRGHDGERPGDGPRRGACHGRAGAHGHRHRDGHPLDAQERFPRIQPGEAPGQLGLPENFPGAVWNLLVRPDLWLPPVQGGMGQEHRVGRTAPPLPARDHLEAVAPGGARGGDPGHVEGPHGRGIAQLILGELRVFPHRFQDPHQK